MKKSHKIKLLIISFFLIAFFIPHKVLANEIHNIEMNVFINKDGSANISEIWQATLNQGTEGYRVFKDLGNASIHNFMVKDESLTVYQSVSNWNSNASFGMKSYKSGIKTINNGVELCWGISSYGQKTYQLNYIINNFVQEYTDYQAIYFNFLNLEQRIGKAKIIISSDGDFSKSNSKIWSFGYEGTVNFNDGKIELVSDGALNNNDYMVGLIKFENKLFDTQNIINKSFDEVYTSAMKGTKVNEPLSIINILIYIATFILELINTLLPYCIIYFIFICLLVKKVSKKKKIDELDFGHYGNKLPEEECIEYYRDIPCNKNIFFAYWLAYNYNNRPVDVLQQGLIGAILLKWVKENKVIILNDKGIVNKNYQIDLSQVDFLSNKYENELLRILKMAAGSNSILETNEFYKWSEDNFAFLEGWFDTILLENQKELETLGFILPSYKINNRYTKKKVSSKLRDMATQLKGFEKFLLTFSAISEREYIEVHLWDEYLMFATLLGIADKVSDQFKDLYPNLTSQVVSDMEISKTLYKFSSSGHGGMSSGIIKYENSLQSSSGSSSGGSTSSGSGGSSSRSGGSSAGGSRGGGFR